MQLHHLAREYYTLLIDTVPEISTWEASFDGGATWVPGEHQGLKTMRWLLAGADADPTGATVISAKVMPMIRVADNPEIVVRSAPTIFYSGPSD